MCFLTFKGLIGSGTQVGDISRIVFVKIREMFSFSYSFLLLRRVKYARKQTNIERVVNECPVDLGVLFCRKSRSGLLCYY
jgi:hypothetical protein